MPLLFAGQVCLHLGPGVGSHLALSDNCTPIFVRQMGNLAHLVVHLSKAVFKRFFRIRKSFEKTVALPHRLSYVSELLNPIFVVAQGRVLACIVKPIYHLGNFCQELSTDGWIDEIHEIAIIIQI